MEVAILQYMEHMYFPSEFLMYTLLYTKYV